MLAIWSNVLPKEELLKACKRQRSQDQPSPKRSRGRMTERKNEAGPDTKEVLLLLARLALRHEDSIQAMLQQQQFILHLKSGQGSLLPLLMKKSQMWHAEEEKKLPLRCCLAQLMLETLQERASKLLQASPQDAIFQARLRQDLVTDSRGTDRYLGSDFPGPSGSIERPAISHLEEVATRSRSASRSRIFMGNDSDCDAMDLKRQTSARTPLTSSSQRAVRICLNKPQVVCWMNSIMIALTWLGLVTMYPMEAWIGSSHLESC